MSDSTVCSMCDSARVNDELTTDNDFSCIDVGFMAVGYRMMLCSGDGKPLRLEIEHFVDGHWHLIGHYNPLFCPNCGADARL